MTPPELRIAVVDDQNDVCDLLDLAFKREFPEIVIGTYTDPKKFLEEYPRELFPVVLLDFDLGDMSASDVVNTIEEINPEVIIIIMTGYIDNDSDICIAKPFRHLHRVVGKIIARVESYRSDPDWGCKLDAVLIGLGIKVNNIKNGGGFLSARKQQ